MDLLFSLRRPFTHASVKGNTISIESDGVPAGTLVVNDGRVAHVLLHVFADTNRVVGHLNNGKVSWLYDPQAYGYTVVIDDCGKIHEVSKLGEE